MPVARTLFQGPSRRLLPLALPRSTCGMLAPRKLHVTTRRPNSTGPTKYAADLPAKKVYQDAFPCTLHYYSWRGPTMAMHGSSMNLKNMYGAEYDNLLGQDVVRDKEDGLVYPGPEGNDPVWSGALMMPHAPLLLELTGNYLDVYEDQKSEGRDIPEPYFFTVPKGFRIPTTLLLAHESGEIFHLMPRAGMPLSALNRELNALFSSRGCSRLPVDEWSEKYDFVEGRNTFDEDEWMSK